MKRFAKISTVCILMTLVAVLLAAPAQALGNTPTKTIVGYGSVGEGIGKQTTVVDFANEALGGFAPFSGNESLAFGNSTSWQASVLKTHLAAPGTEAGIKKTFSDASVFKKTNTLSVEVIAQASSYLVTLRLSGVDQNGSPLTFEARMNATTNHWQTITFDISDFVDLIDTNAPVSITLLASANSEESVGAEWMIKSIYLNTPEAFPEYLISTLCAVGGFAIGFVFFFMIYRSTCKKNRRPRPGEER